MKGLFTTATDTNVGKTWVGSRLVAELKRLNVDVQARKPIESGWPSSLPENDTDAWKLANAMGQIDALPIVCPNRFTAALSPDRAAMLEDKEVTLKKLYQDCLNEVKESDFLYVEGAGGFYSPICSDGLNADLAVSLDLPVLLVVEDRLGCINQTLLNVEAIARRGLKLTAIALNKPAQVETDQNMDNFSDIQARVDCEIISFGFKQNSAESINRLAQLVIKT